MAFLKLIPRIEAKSIEQDGCWIWQGATSRNRPVISYKGKVITVIRAIALNKNIIRNSGVAFPRCGNPLCVNPEHIGVRTLSENVSEGMKSMDKVAHALKISKAHAGKTGITDKMVQEIRMHSGPNIEIARKLGMHPGTVVKIKNYQSRPDYTNPFRLL